MSLSEKIEVVLPNGIKLKVSEKEALEIYRQICEQLKCPNG